jgi:hypothetical protein
VVRVGGDFMEGRFYVSLIPLILLCGEQVVHEFSRSRAERQQPATDSPPRRSPLRAGALIMIGLMAASAVGVRMIGPRKSKWSLTDESSYYPIAGWSPMVIDHSNYRVAIILGRSNAGIEGRDVNDPIIATGAIGLLGYYSHMTLVDRLGLTDATVAHREITKRGRPGHEKWAESSYIRGRGTHFIRGGGYPKWFRTYGTIRWGAKTGGRQWYILKYDRELMNAIREAEPDIWFHDFEIYIDRYIARLPNSSAKKVRKEYDYFKRYYFDHNDDPERREAFAIYFQWVREGKQPRDLLKAGRWDVYKKRGADASKREREMRQARSERKRIREGLPPRPTATTKPAAKPKPSRVKPAIKPEPKPTDGDDEIGDSPAEAEADDDGDERDDDPAEDDAGDDAN